MKKYICWTAISLCVFLLVYYARYLIAFTVWGVVGVFDTSIQESQKKDFLICTYQALPFEYHDSLTSFSIEPDQVWQSYRQWEWDKKEKKFVHSSLRGLIFNIPRNGTKHQDIPWDIGWPSNWDTKRSCYLIRVAFPGRYGEATFEDWSRWYQGTMSADTLRIPIVSAAFDESGRRGDSFCMDWQNHMRGPDASPLRKEYGELVLVRVPEESGVQKKR